MKKYSVPKKFKSSVGHNNLDNYQSLREMQSKIQIFIGSQLQIALTGSISGPLLIIQIILKRILSGFQMES